MTENERLESVLGAENIKNIKKNTCKRYCKYTWIDIFIDRARKTPGFSHGDIRAQLLPTQKHDITPSPFRRSSNCFPSWGFFCIQKQNTFSSRHCSMARNRISLERYYISRLDRIPLSADCSSAMLNNSSTIFSETLFRVSRLTTIRPITAKLFS